MSSIVHVRTAATRQIELKKSRPETVILPAGANTKCVEAGIRIVVHIQRSSHHQEGRQP